MPEPEPQTAPRATERLAGGKFGILRLYVKDISFESPQSPQVFAVEWRPNLDFHMRTEATVVRPGEYEVVLTVTVTISLEDKPVMLVELQQAGLFGITGLTQDELAPVLGSMCPGILFPYAREVISDLSVRGGFPQVVLAPVNFEALYEQQKTELAASASPESGEADREKPEG